jgi:hypothetical protein
LAKALSVAFPFQRFKEVCREAHADLNSATNIAQRVGDAELLACKDKKATKALLMQRHDAWRKATGWP